MERGGKEEREGPAAGGTGGGAAGARGGAGSGPFTARVPTGEVSPGARTAPSLAEVTGPSAEPVAGGRGGPAFLFPARDAGCPGMGRDICRASPAARRVFEEASEELGLDLASACWEDGAEALRSGPVAMAGTMATSLACMAALAERGVRPRAVAGWSQGEFTALAAASVLEAPDALRLVYRLEGIIQSVPGRERGRMARVMGLPTPALDEICRRLRARGREVYVALYIAPDQNTLSGEAGAVEEARAQAKAAGAALAFMLPGEGAFHSPLMAEAARQAQPILAGLRFSDPALPLVLCYHGQEVRTGEEARSLLGRQLAAPVRWEAVVRTLLGLGVSALVEVGPGRTVSGNTRLVAGSVPCLSVQDPRTLEEALRALDRGQ
ncbi:MAG: ACP S-malonyltransferase [Acetobacteraceae bacterium]|nr:ACP S-malonyltransferase [Acetobacteraceae bacterium]